MSWLVAHAVERDPARIAAEQPALWREIRRFNLPVKLALAAAHRVVPAIERPAEALLVGVAPRRPGSPELRKISHDLDVAFESPGGQLRVNPIYTLHAVDNLALSALSLALGNRAACVNIGAGAGQAWVALEHALEHMTDAAIVFAGDQGQASWRGEADPDNELGVAIALSRTRSVGARVRVVAIERADGSGAIQRSGDPIQRGEGGGEAMPHSARGLAAWLAALATAPAGRFAYEVPARDGDGLDRITIIAEVS